MTETASRTLRVVGTRPPRPDGVDKVTGRAQYGADVHWPGTLVGRVLRSPHAHARILSIDTTAARAIPGVIDIITGDDLRPIPEVPPFDKNLYMNLQDVATNVLARDKVLYHGHAVAAVAATTSEAAEAALAAIVVDYEPLPHVLDAEQALGEDAPVLHEALRPRGVFPPVDRPGNLAARHVVERGDVDAALATVDHVVTGRFTTSAVHQAYIEPHAAAARVAEDGTATVWVTTQGPYMVRDVCAAIVGVPSGSIRVVPSEIGGGFGGKTTVYVEPLALALSRRTGRPVKFVLRRDEVFAATGPAPGGVIEATVGANKDGRIVAAKARLVFEAGAFPGSPVGAAANAMFMCYDIPHLLVEGYDVVVNKPKVTAYRAPGAPISTFASESLLDELARELSLDPIEFRLRNAVKQGDTTAQGVVLPIIGLRETLEAAATSEHYQRGAVGSSEPADRSTRYGRGVACGYWPNNGMQSTATVNLSSDGTVIVVVGTPDIGGSRASMAIIAAEELGVDVATIRPVLGDTQTVGYNSNTAGSRVTFATGWAVIGACRQVVEELRRRAATTWDVEVESVHWEHGAARRHDANDDATDDVLTIAQLAADAFRSGGPLSATFSLNAQGAGPAFATHVCDVEVDIELGSVRILRYLAVQDAGRAIHPSYVEGQMQGAVAQGVGWALNEEYVWRADGRLDNPGFLDYRIPVASDLPMIDTHIVEVPNPKHPYGVRGVGEVGIVPPMAAIANAIRDAVGVRAHHLPISPPRLQALLADHELA